MNQLDTDRTRHGSLTVAILFLIWSVPLAAAEKNVESGQYFVTQSWSQEKNFQRPYYVNVPQRVGEQKLPVLIFLHGNGGTGKGAMHGFLRRHRTLANKYMLT